MGQYVSLGKVQCQDPIKRFGNGVPGYTALASLLFCPAHSSLNPKTSEEGGGGAGGEIQGPPFVNTVQLKLDSQGTKFPGKLHQHHHVG